MTPTLTESHSLTEARLGLLYSPMISRGMLLMLTAIVMAVVLRVAFGDASMVLTQLLGGMVVPLGVLMMVFGYRTSMTLTITVRPGTTEVDGYCGWFQSSRPRSLPTRKLKLERQPSLVNARSTLTLRSPEGGSLMYLHVLVNDADLARTREVIHSFQDQAEQLEGRGRAEIPEGLRHMQRGEPLQE